MEVSTESTLYPKITHHITTIVRTLRKQLRDPDHPEEPAILEPIPVVGTVKLHGTHADILIYSDDTIVLQSRNNTNLVTTADNHGFASAMATRRTAILRIRDLFIARWKEINDDSKLDMSLPVVIAGEWIGEKVQKGVAIAQLSKRLVIISARVNGRWIADSEYADIEAPEDGIYNISRGGIFHSMLDLEDPQRTMHELEPLAEKVATLCPFADTFDIKGEGEGIVWKVLPYISDPALWFKTKGGKFKPTFTPASKKAEGDMLGKQEAAAAVARAWCSEQRMEQGLDFLREKGIDRSMKGIGAFLKWVHEDILVEEKGYIEENKVEKAMLKQEITALAKPWYIEKYMEGDD